MEGTSIIMTPPFPWTFLIFGHRPWPMPAPIEKKKLGTIRYDFPNKGSRRHETQLPDSSAALEIHLETGQRKKNISIGLGSNPFVSYQKFFPRDFDFDLRFSRSGFRPLRCRYEAGDGAKKKKKWQQSFQRFRYRLGGSGIDSLRICR